MDPVIVAERLSKAYRIGSRAERQRSFRQSLLRAAGAPLRRLRGRGREDHEIFWALRDVSFEVARGEVLGIVGQNGAGKSTLLRILSRITEPSAGRAWLRGRVGSLLEVGTGFHPELTGRENVFLNGAILGMRRAEIAARFDEIVAFSGVEAFLDTPVKRYSSGMRMRLAFAVAAHLDPEILLVDEVLAVGDAAFQQKCLGKMGDVAREGRTILFVSHNLPMLSRLCDRALLVAEGRIALDADADSVIARHLESQLEANAAAASEGLRSAADPELELCGVDLLDAQGRALPAVASGSGFVCRLRLRTARRHRNLVVSIGVDDLLGDRICFFHTAQQGARLALVPPETAIDCRVFKCPLPQGEYLLSLKVHAGDDTLFWLPRAIRLSVVAGDFFGSGRLLQTRWSGRCLVEHSWEASPKAAEGDA